MKHCCPILIMSLLLSMAGGCDRVSDSSCPPSVTLAHEYEYYADMVKEDVATGDIGQEWGTLPNLSVYGYDFPGSTVFHISNLEPSDGRYKHDSWIVWTEEGKGLHEVKLSGSLADLTCIERNGRKLLVARGTVNRGIKFIDFLGLDKDGLRRLGHVGDGPWQTRRGLIVELRDNVITVYGMQPNNDDGLTPELREFLAEMDLTIGLAE
ncbi:hypothetical protein LCGC14_0015890 [marine sediment metagenome]|uniref:Uncharacterized protein n=1 Tax=marine sediment metagenome TaxID=412755 RepID=A0A0F9WF49_9ZZZZ|nr:hypothetical protein [Phycisphaerae bacterium]